MSSKSKNQQQKKHQRERHQQSAAEPATPAASSTPERHGLDIPDEVLHFMNTRGRERVMWASDYAILTFDRAVTDGLALPLREGVTRRYMRENALAVFNFD